MLGRTAGAAGRSCTAGLTASAAGSGSGEAARGAAEGRAGAAGRVLFFGSGCRHDLIVRFPTSVRCTSGCRRVLPRMFLAGRGSVLFFSGLLSGFLTSGLETGISFPPDSFCPFSTAISSGFRMVEIPRIPFSFARSRSSFSFSFSYSLLIALPHRIARAREVSIKKTQNTTIGPQAEPVSFPLFVLSSFGYLPAGNAGFAG